MGLKHYESNVQKIIPEGLEHNPGHYGGLSGRGGSGDRRDNANAGTRVVNVGLGNAGPRLSVGKGTIPVLAPSGILSHVVPRRNNKPPIPIPDATPWRRTVVVAQDWVHYHTLKDQGIAVSPPGTGGAPTPIVRGAPVSNVQPPPSIMAGAPTYSNLPDDGETDMDLGTILTDVFTGAVTTYVDNKWGPGNGGNTYGPVNTVPTSPALFDIPFVDVIGQNPGADGCGNYVYKKVCGQYKWVKARKRRRKQLASKSDLRDLSALKGILGNGKAFETWIAVHG